MEQGLLQVSGLRSRKDAFRGRSADQGRVGGLAELWKAGRRGSYTQCACSTWGTYRTRLAAQRHTARCLAGAGHTAGWPGTAEPRGRHHRGFGSPGQATESRAGWLAGTGHTASLLAGTGHTASRLAASQGSSRSSAGLSHMVCVRLEKQTEDRAGLTALSWYLIPRLYVLAMRDCVFLVAACCFSSPRVSS